MARHRYLLTELIFAGFFLGILAGWLIGEPLAPLAGYLAQIFLRLLNMAVLPLIVTSIVSAVLSIGGGRGLGRIGLKTFVYYIGSSLIAICTGLLLVNLFQPGAGLEVGLEKEVSRVAAQNQNLFDLLLEIIPKNPFQALARGDVLPVIFFSILFAYFVTRLKKRQADLMTRFFQAAFDTMLRLTLFVVWSAPLGVFGIVTELVARTGFSGFQSLGFYFITVLAGLMIHFFITLPLLLYSFTSLNPLRHLRGMLPSLVTAFSTCSTMVALPLTIKGVTRTSGVSEKIAHFTLPIGATVNMDGTALYECVAVIFIAQVYGIKLTLFSQVIVVITALMASIGAASVPMTGLVMMSIILKAVGLPLEAVGIILAVDRILDMFRTMVNVYSDSCGSVIVARWEGERFR